MITRERFATLMLRWVNRLHLDDWQFAVESGEPRGGAVAQTHIDWRNKTATIRIPLDLYARCTKAQLLVSGDSEDAVLQDTVAHELAHLLMEPLYGIFCEQLDYAVGTSPSADILKKLHYDMVEITTNNFVRVLLEAYHAEDALADAQAKADVPERKDGGSEEADKQQTQACQPSNAFAILSQQYNKFVD